MQKVIVTRGGYWKFRHHRKEKPRLEAGHRHRRCRGKVDGGHCSCGLHGKKYYRIPIAYRVEMWFAPSIAYVAQVRDEWSERIISRAKKWGKKRALRMLNKFGYRDGRMEYR